MSNPIVLTFDKRIQRLVSYRVTSAIYYAANHERHAMWLWAEDNGRWDTRSLDCYDHWINEIAMTAINACAACAAAMPALDPQTLQAHCAAIALALVPEYWNTPEYNPVDLLSDLIR